MSNKQAIGLLCSRALLLENTRIILKTFYGEDFLLEVSTGAWKPWRHKIWDCPQFVLLFIHYNVPYTTGVVAPRKVNLRATAIIVKLICTESF